MIQQNKIKIFIITFLILCLSPAIISAQDETFFACGGDNETMISCSFGDIENSFFGLLIPEEVADAIEKETGRGASGAESAIIQRYLLNLWYFIFFVIFPLFILLLLLLWYIIRKNSKK